jgi:hypothetical protein
MWKMLHTVYVCFWYLIIVVFFLGTVNIFIASIDGEIDQKTHKKWASTTYLDLNLGDNIILDLYMDKSKPTTFPL